MSTDPEKKPFLPKSITRLEDGLREETPHPRIRGLRTFCVSSISAVVAFFVAMRIEEHHTRATQNALAGFIAIGGLLAATVASIGLLELVSGLPYVKWVTSWERLAGWKRTMILGAVIIVFVILLFVGARVYFYIEELRNPGQTAW